MSVARRGIAGSAVSLCVFALAACGGSLPDTSGTAGTSGQIVGTAGVSGGGTAGGGASGTGVGGGVGGTVWAAGRVWVLQPEGSVSPVVRTSGLFAAIVPCHPSSPAACSCSGAVVEGCMRRRCTGNSVGHDVRMSDLLGYTGIVDDILATAPVDVGTLSVSDGTNAFTYQFLYDRQDDLPDLWTAGELITVAATGGDVGGFAVTIPFPPRVTFEPLPAPPYPDLIDVRWTARDDTAGMVEAVSAYKWSTDTQYGFSVTTCRAGVGSGKLTLPLDGSASPPSSISSRAIAVRMTNALSTGDTGLLTDVVVESYDTGVLDDVPAPP